jgi:hypothetical protein
LHRSVVGAPHVCHFGDMLHNFLPFAVHCFEILLQFSVI